MNEKHSLPYTIALFAPYGTLGTTFARGAAELPVRLITRLGLTLEDAVSEARKLADTDPPEVICSRGGTADYLQTQMDIPVVDISTTGLDLLRTLLPFRAKLHRVAFFHYKQPMPEVQTVARALGMEISEYTFHTRDEMKVRMLEATAEGAELGVGGVLVAEMREICGVDGIVIEAGEDAISRCLHEAIGIARVRRVEKLRHARVMTILDTIAEGIIVTDEANTLTLINPAAEKLLGIRASTSLGRDARDVVPNTRTWEVLQQDRPELNELQDIGGHTIVTNRVPIKSNGQPMGVVCTFSGADRIQQAERRLRQRRDSFRARWRLEDIVTGDPDMREIRELARSYAQTDATILIQGPSGTGKELFAQGIHRASSRADGPFVAVNCAAIPPELLESELFGYEEGAFTGARRSGKAGYFELAHDGTLFLDEISEMPLHLQSRLLRVLQEREVMHLGGAQMLRINVRVICATNRDLRTEVRGKRFREDLYFRCNVLPLRLPPLTRRGTDVLLLAEHFLAGALPGTTRERIREIVGALRTRLLAWEWPGNVRELGNCMERFALFLTLFANRPWEETWRRMLQQDFSNGDLSSGPVGSENTAQTDTDNGPFWNSLLHLSLRDALHRTEDALLAEAMRACNNEPECAAARLGISRVTLWRKLNRTASGSGERPASHRQ